MCVGWRRLSTESAGDGEKRRWLWLTGLCLVDIVSEMWRLGAKCRSMQSIRKGSFFENSRLFIDDIFCVTFCWAAKLSVKSTAIMACVCLHEFCFLMAIFFVLRFCNICKSSRSSTANLFPVPRLAVTSHAVSCRPSILHLLFHE